MKTIFIESDLHVGSAYGQMPENFTDDNGNVPKLNAAQQFLKESRDDAIRQVIQHFGKPDLYVINGDLIDGEQPKNRGAGLTLRTVEEQCRAALEVIQPVRWKFGKDCPLVVTNGTSYHEQPQELEDLLVHLGAEEDKESGKHYFRQLQVPVDGVLVEFFHDIPFSSAYNRYGALVREVHEALMEAAERRTNRIDVAVRSHTHSRLEIYERGIHALITPCWQVPTPFSKKSSPRKITGTSTIGCAVLSVDGRAKAKGVRCSQMTSFEYPLPLIKPLRIKV